MTVRLTNEFKRFETATSGSTEWRIARYSSERLDAIARVLGIERRNAIDDEVTKAFQRRVNPADSAVFSLRERRKNVTRSMLKTQSCSGTSKRIASKCVSAYLVPMTTIAFTK